MTDIYRPPVEELLEQLLADNPTLPSGRGEAPMESSSTVLRHKGGGVYDIDANTAQGRKQFRNVREYEETNRDAQSEFYESLSQKFQLYYGGTRSRRPRVWATIFQWADPEVEQVTSHTPQETDESGDILELLDRADGAKLRQLIIESEAMPFEGQRRNRIVELLKAYIEQNRDSTDREDLIAVAAAIRKFVALLDLAEIGWLATLLEAGYRVQPSLDTELEIAKMVYRRYSVSPPERPDPHPALSARLADIAGDYLRPRVFAHERFPTVAMLATQALLVMRSERARSIIEQVNNLPFAWFRQQLRRRMERAVAQMPEGTARHEIATLVQTIQAN